jgi:hypothetical protein
VIHGSWDLWSANVRNAFACVATPSRTMLADLPIGLLSDVRDRLAIDLADSTETWLLDAYREVSHEFESFENWFNSHFCRRMPDKSDVATLRFVLHHQAPATGMGIVQAVCEAVRDGAKVGIVLRGEDMHEHALMLLYVLIREIRTHPRIHEAYWPSLRAGLNDVVSAGAAAYFLWQSAQAKGADERSGMWAVLAVAPLIEEPRDPLLTESNAMRDRENEKVLSVLVDQQTAGVKLLSAVNPGPLIAMLSSVLAGTTPLSDEHMRGCAGFVTDLNLYDVFRPLSALWPASQFVLRLAKALPTVPSFQATLEQLAQTHPEHSGAQAFCDRYLPAPEVRQAFIDAMSARAAAARASLPLSRLS